VRAPERDALLPPAHRFVGPLVRTEALPVELRSWAAPVDARPQVVVALGTFLSMRSDLLVRLATALRTLPVRAAIARGATSADDLGPLPDDWMVAPVLPQVAMLRSADLMIHHGGNNSVQECLAAGVRQLILPMSTDQFANAADLERAGVALTASPNGSTAALATAIGTALGAPPPSPVPVPDHTHLFGPQSD
jgi:zeaxanthin glucosyltransferase